MISTTQARLREWGKWASGGYPTIGSMFRGLFGRGGGEGEMPAAVQEIDIIVCRADTQDRAVLIAFYGRGGSFRDKALALGLSRSTLRRRLDRAEWYVNAVLDGFGPFTLHSGPECGFYPQE